jgi:cation:H+ antiporter
MDIPQILLHLGLITLTSLAIMYACDTFETASRWLGGHFPQGIRGATINAIGSSLPELFTKFFLLFVYHNQDGFSAGIATCAGSAIFNAVVIPGLCILAVLFWGVRINGKHESVEHISVKRSVFLRDASFFLLSCGVLIILLSNAQLGWKHGAILVGMYFLYIGYIVWEYRTNRTSTDDDEDEDDDEDDEDEDEPANLFVALMTMQFQWILYKDKPLNRQRAWVLLGIGVVAIAVPCHILATSCVALAKHLHVHPFYTAVIFAAAATSVPDTIISIRDARQGDYDDAISNAFGSNIFDINIALGLPLLLYGLIYGPVKLTGIMTPAGKSVAAVQELQLLLLLISFVILLLFLVGKSLGKVKAVLLFSLYGVFIGYCVGRAYNASWLEPIAKMLQFTF